MITYDKSVKGYILSCDICGNEAEEIFESFGDAVDGKEGLGWRSQKHNGEWEDVCTECDNK